VSVIADAYLAGVSTRRVEKLVQQLGVERMSKSQVSRLVRSLDQIVEQFRTRPLEEGPYPYLVLDALERGCREGGRTVNACVVHAAAVNADGYRESLGLDVVTSEDGAAWLGFLRSLVARGLGGVRLVTSDAHPGLVDSIAATLPGASWQRCRTHFMRNLLSASRSRPSLSSRRTSPVSVDSYGLGGFLLHLLLFQDQLLVVVR
jgi:putative transposase